MKIRDLQKLTIRRLGQAAFNGWVTKVPSLLTNSLKISFLRCLGAQIGSNVKIGSRVRVLGPGNLVLGNHVALAHSVVLDARGGLTLSDGVLVGFETVLLTYTHASSDPHQPVHYQGTIQGPVSVGSNTWLGARCLVLPDTDIGSSAIVGAMSVVSRNIPNQTIAAGVPAAIVKPRA